MKLMHDEFALLQVAAADFGVDVETYAYATALARAYERYPKLCPGVVKTLLELSLYGHRP